MPLVAEAEIGTLSSTVEKLSHHATHSDTLATHNNPHQYKHQHCSIGCSKKIEAIDMKYQ
jgi:hypothetical protein